MTDRFILSELSDGVLRALINRPASRNAFNMAAYDQLAAAIREGDRDEDVRCIIIGTTNDNFSAGWDLLDDSEPTDDEPHGYQALMSALEASRKPIIAAVRGYAIGIGFTMLGQCDLVLVGESSRFRAPFAPLGLCPEAGSSVTLPALIGSQLTAELFFTGRWMGAEEAVRAGLGLRVVADDALMGEAMELAKKVAANPLQSLTATKSLMVAGRSLDVVEARRAEDELFTQLLHSDAYRSALAGFASKVKS